MKVPGFFRRLISSGGILLVLGLLLLSVHSIYRDATASELYFWELSPADGSTGVYPGTFSIRFNQPVTTPESLTGVLLRSLSNGYPDIAISNTSISTYEGDDTFYINIGASTSEPPISGGAYRVVVDRYDVLERNSADYYPASGQYWSGFPYFCDSCGNQWRVTFVDLFAQTQYATPTANSILDLADFATTVRSSYRNIPTAVVGNGISNVTLNECAGALIGSVGTDRPTSVSGNEARLVLSQSLVNSLLDNYDASVSGANRCVDVTLPAGYVRHPSYNLGSTARAIRYTLKYIAHERLAENGSIIQPDQLFSVDFNQQIELSATTTAAQLFDVDAGVYVASIPMTDGEHAYIGDGDVSDGMTSDTLYLDFANAYALEAGKEYRILIPGIAVRKFNSWDFVRYDIDGAEYSFTVANDADEPEVESYVPSGTEVATTTSEIVVTYDEPVTLSGGTAAFDIWTSSVATATVSSVSNVYESVSGDEYTIDLAALLQEAFGSSALLEETTYWVRIPADAVVDDESNNMSDSYIVSFQTVETPEVVVEPEVEPQEQRSSRGPSGRRARTGGVGDGGNQSGIIPAGSLGQLTDPVYEDLSFGSVGDAVYRLQQALNRVGFYVAEDGAGAPGQETQVFGTSTQSALIRFQQNFTINPSAGFFGPVTRALLGFILNW